METLTRSGFARLMGVDRSTVTRWVQDGRISLTPDGRIDPVAARAALPLTGSPMPHHMARQDQIDEQRAQRAAAVAADAAGQGAAAPPAQSGAQGAAAGASGSPVDEAPAAGLRLKMARVRREEMQADIAAMERDRMAKSLLLRSDVDFLIDDLGRTAGALLDRLADRYAPHLAAHLADPAALHQALVEAARDIRTELAAHIGRRVEALP